MSPESDSPQDPVTGEVVTFTLEADEMTLARLGSLAEDLHGLLREIQSNFLPSGRVRWRVERISMSSPLRLESRPVSDDTDVTVSGLRDLSGIVSNGLKQIQQQAVRPPYFTDAALEKARDVVTMIRKTEGLLSVDSTQLDEHVVANVNEVLGAIVTAIGSVEGYMEAFNVHGSNRYFYVYDILTGTRIRCDFGHRIAAAEVGATAEKRVVVHGEIRYREDGQLIKVMAHSIEVKPDDEDLPSANDVLGILGG